MGGELARTEKIRNIHHIFVRGKRSFEDLRVDGRISLKRILRIREDMD
jgi:hypothetical protein